MKTWRTRPLAWQGFGRSEEGVTALEFALVAPMVIALMIGVLQIGVLELMSTNLDLAVTRTTRKILTGAADRPASAAAFEEAICGVMVDARDKCRERLAISVQKAADFAAGEAVANAQPTGQYDIGGPGSLILVRATYRWPLILPIYAGGFRLSGPTEAVIDARAVFRNEPYA